MVIVDTTVWVDYFADRDTPQTEWLDRHLSTDRIGLTDLILCEVLQGVGGDVRFKQTQQDLSRFEVYASPGRDLAIASAENYRFLRSKGITVRKTIDCLIATFCLAAGHALLHNDRDFDPFEDHLGLRVVARG